MTLDKSQPRTGHLSQESKNVAKKRGRGRGDGMDANKTLEVQNQDSPNVTRRTRPDTGLQEVSQQGLTRLPPVTVEEIDLAAEVKEINE